MQLSRNFSLAEFSKSNTAARLGIDNTPPDDIIERLKKTAEQMERVRTVLGDAPITVNSAYRSLAVNKAVGGSKTSAHCGGFAVDFTHSKLTIRQAVALIRASDIMFDQLIDEFGQWVHIGFGPGKRKQVLSARKVGGVTQYRII